MIIIDDAVQKKSILQFTPLSHVYNIQDKKEKRQNHQNRPPSGKSHFRSYYLGDFHPILGHLRK